MWSVLLITVCITMVMAKELTYYVDFEHPNYTYNPAIFEYVKGTAQRYSRRDPIHYINVQAKFLAVLGNEITVDAYVYEFLSNEYRRSMIEMHFRLCDAFIPTKYHLLVPFYVKYFSNSPCPFPKGEYQFMNMSVPNLPILRTFPYRKGRLFVNFKRGNEHVAALHIDTVIKERFL